jgi:tetratricopeptide (TPR) repeat protein
LASARQEGRTLAPWSPQLADFAFARRLRPDEPDDPDILVLQGTSMRSFYPKKALATITRASELRPEDPGILYERVLIRLDLGHHKKASEDIARILELNPDHVKSLCFRGSQYLEQELSYEALEDFDHALEIEPDSPHALYGHAVALLSDFPITLVLTPAVNDLISGALLELDRAEELVNHFEKPLGYDLFYWWRSQALLRLRRFEEALDDCESYIADNPEDPDGPTMLDNIKKLEGNSQYTDDRGVPSTHYVKDTHTLYRCWNDMGAFSLHDKMIPMESRLPFFNRELESPTDGQIFEEWVLLANRGDTLAWTGRNEEALADFNRALELRPENAYIYALRGEVLQHLDRPREALTNYDRAIELQADDSDLLSRRSGLRDELGIDT